VKGDAVLSFRKQKGVRPQPCGVVHQSGSHDSKKDEGGREIKGRRQHAKNDKVTAIEEGQ